MPDLLHAMPEMAIEYARWFVNRRAYTLQSDTPHPASGRHYYYRPRKQGNSLELTPWDIQRHLAGEITLGIYAINPRTQRVKWMAIDADYRRALEDLLKLQFELGRSGIQAALEQSRRGGHLWIFFEKPVPDREVGRYISFFSPDGGRLGWLQRLDRIGANGVHGVVVASEFVSVEMARIEQTYQLLITRHRIGAGTDGKRPSVESAVLFRGVDGYLPQEPLKQGLTPEFFTRAGEVKPIPEQFVDAVKVVTVGASCINCRPCHGLVEKAAPVT